MDTGPRTYREHDARVESQDFAEGGEGEWCEAMEWAVPAFPKNQVDAAGKMLVQGPVITLETALDDWNHALDVINNWRAAHGYPLNTFQIRLREKARRVDTNAIVAQRTKRLWSIWHKLDRFPTMQLSQMQDIGGCRAILPTAKQVVALVEDYKNSSLRHRLRTVTNYIEKPRGSGYRGVHLIYEYVSDKAAKSAYNGLRIEMQLRSSLQHTWATTVETVGTFVRQALKSSIGEDDWLRFFSLMSTAIAFREGTPCVPNTPTDQDALRAELAIYANRVNARYRLHTFGNALQYLEQPSARESKAHLFLLELDSAGQNITVTGFHRDQQREASAAYLEAEKRIVQTGKDGKTSAFDAVLVSVDSVASLRRAYPNYFLDTLAFAGLLDEALSGRPLDCVAD